MTKIRSTPLARRNLDSQLATLKGDPDGWQSEHLRRAFQIVEKRVGRQPAREIVIEAVRAAARAVKEAFRRGLKEAQQSALTDFNKNCRAIANRTKLRLRKEVRMQLDQAAGSAFATGVADLDTVQLFFCRCKNIVKGWPKDKPACAIFKHLVTVKDDRTHGDAPLEEAPLENTIKIALDYEALPTKARSGCESGLAQLISEKADRLTAHDVFECLHCASEPFMITTSLEAQPDIIHHYLAELDALWTSHGLEFGRGNHPEDGTYSSPFQEFGERVLLEQRDPRSRLFNPISDPEKAVAWASYHKIPKDFFISREDISAASFSGYELITDWTLRTYLNSRSAFKKSE